MSKRKETISVPTKKELAKASQNLRRGGMLGGRVMAEQSVAARQSKKK